MTNFLLNDVPVRLTNLKIGRDAPALDDIGEPGVFPLVWEPDNPEKLLVLLSSGSNLCTDSTNSWSLPNVEITRTAGNMCILYHCDVCNTGLENGDDANEFIIRGLEAFFVE